MDSRSSAFYGKRPELSVHIESHPAACCVTSSEMMHHLKLTFTHCLLRYECTLIVRKLMRLSAPEIEHNGTVCMANGSYESFQG